ncbi:hypothetical protein O7600_02335 [Micromonospora sp. WMMA1998]|uniref:hypothetical protein n=1 Tax=Micromonospora sp. WMMA1998 TaxID=3015167 RepID=UPI00248C620F|nr:hypothetical protein [Micromonospora sp. WMMA1998]WBC15695.1 hypothetical protein O7600_02335 [Micromonospora sp. WMMA1998]
MSDEHGSSWVPDACALPTTERPLRLAEFDRLFRAAVRAVDRPSARHLRLRLDGADQVERTARDLAARESACCSFFTFDLARPDDGPLTLDIRVPAAHTDVLDALAARAVSRHDR